MGVVARLDDAATLAHESAAAAAAFARVGFAIAMSKSVHDLQAEPMRARFGARMSDIAIENTMNPFDTLPPQA
jgi:hypothetical protein